MLTRTEPCASTRSLRKRISRRFRRIRNQFRGCVERAWFKLPHRDRGDAIELRGKLVPKEKLMAGHDSRRRHPVIDTRNVSRRAEAKLLGLASRVDSGLDRMESD